jgi:hypothetical protein
LKPSLSPARIRFKEITNWAKIGFCQSFWHGRASWSVSVAGCLGYDVLASTIVGKLRSNAFQLLVV